MKNYIKMLGVFSVISFVSLFGYYNYSAETANTSTVSAPDQTTHLFFDSGGVLFETSKKNAIWELGPQVLLSYYRHNDTSMLQTRFYEMLNTITQTQGNTVGMCDDEGNQMPELMMDWLRGARPNKEIVTLIEDFIENNQSWFANKSEKNALRQMGRMIFTPHIFAKTRVLINETVELLKSCKERGFKVYLMSNWDKESIVELQKKYPKVFDLFDDLIISGNIGYVKPQPEFFQSIAHQFNPQSSILLDDQPENIAAAQKAGMQGILVSKERKSIGAIPDIKDISYQLAQITAPQEMATVKVA